MFAPAGLQSPGWSTADRTGLPGEEEAWGVIAQALKAMNAPEIRTHRLETAE